MRANGTGTPIGRAKDGLEKEVWMSDTATRATMAHVPPSTPPSDSIIHAGPSSDRRAP